MGAGGGWRGGCEGRRVPLGQEAIGTFIFAPLEFLRVSVSYSSLQRGDETRHIISTKD